MQYKIYRGGKNISLLFPDNRTKLGVWYSALHQNKLIRWIIR